MICNKKTIPIIDCTDLYHPHQDVGDNFDILAPYAMPEIDLRAVILDTTQRLRQPPIERPDVDPNLFHGDAGNRDPGFIPITTSGSRRAWSWNRPVSSEPCSTKTGRSAISSPPIGRWSTPGWLCTTASPRRPAAARWSAWNAAAIRLMWRRCRAAPPPPPCHPAAAARRRGRR